MTAPGYLFLLLVTVVVLTAARRKDYDDEDEKEHLQYIVTDEVAFEVTIEDADGPGEDYTGTFVVGLFGKLAPMSCMNFRAIAEGYQRPGKKGKKLSYKNSPIHRIVPDFIIQMGDITVGDGTGGESVFGCPFVDENFKLSHQAAGFLSMANHGKDTNGSQFFITLTKSRWLDGKHVVFAKVVNGMDVIKKIGDVPANRNTALPFKKVTITDCEVRDLDEKYELTEDQMKSDEDVK